LLDYVGRIFGLTGQERAARVEELLELVGLAVAAKRRIGGFSHGMRQRLGIAQALVNRPAVLFLDEPVSALDPAGRREVLDLILRLRGTCTVVMSTHILADVERVCDVVGIIDQGRMVVTAAQEELTARYAVPAFEIESDGDLAGWVETLARLSWVDNASVEGRRARVVVRDVEVAKQELLLAALQAGLVLTRYEMMRPSLEDVFLRLVGKRGEAR